MEAQGCAKLRSLSFSRTQSRHLCARNFCLPDDDGKFDNTDAEMIYGGSEALFPGISGQIVQQIGPVVVCG